MTLALRIFVGLFLLAMPTVASSQVASEPPKDAKRFVLFIHAGSKTPMDESLTNKIALTLAARGYIVRSPEKDRDQVGGPGVDYFIEDDLPAANDIAAVVNDQLPTGAKKLQPRRQRVSNKPGYIGVWLYD